MRTHQPLTLSQLSQRLPRSGPTTRMLKALACWWSSLPWYVLTHLPMSPGWTRMDR